MAIISSMRLTVTVLTLGALALLAACRTPAGGPTPPPPAILRPTNTPRPMAPAGETPTPVPQATPAVPPPSAVALQLAYIAQGDLWLTGIEGPGERLTEQGGITDLAWSPDGTRLAYVRQEGSEPRIYLLSADRSQPPQPLTSGSAPAWSPDSRRLAFNRDYQVYIIDADGSAERRLSQDETWVWGNPVFNAEGESVIAAGAPRDFIGASGNTEFYLYRFPLPTGSPVRLPGLSAPFNGRLPAALRLAPDGAHLALFTSFHNNACSAPGDYIVLGSDGSDAHSVVPEKLAQQTDPARDISLVGLGFTWGPAGDRLALAAQVNDCSRFYSEGRGPILGPAAIYIVDLEARLLAELAKPGSELSWSADGSRLAYVARPSPIQPEGTIFTLAVDGSDERAIGPGQKPVWRP